MRTVWEHDLLRSINEADDDLFHKVIEQCAWIMKKSGFVNWKGMLENAGLPRKELDHKLSKQVIYDSLEDENYHFENAIMHIIDRREADLAELADAFIPLFNKGSRDAVYEMIGLVGSSKGFFEELLGRVDNDPYWAKKFANILEELKGHRLASMKGTKQIIAQIEGALKKVEPESPLNDIFRAIKEEYPNMWSSNREMAFYRYIAVNASDSEIDTIAEFGDIGSPKVLAALKAYKG